MHSTFQTKTFIIVIISEPLEHYKNILYSIHFSKYLNVIKVKRTYLNLVTGSEIAKLTFSSRQFQIGFEVSNTKLRCS